MVSGAGSGGAIAFLPAKATPEECLPASPDNATSGRIAAGYSRGKPMTMLPISLTIAAGAALLNIWLAMRVGRVRSKEQVFVGDGGNEPLTRRMRAHSHDVDNTPLMLILLNQLGRESG